MHILRYLIPGMQVKSCRLGLTDASQDSLASIHPYPARFIPDIPRELISSLGCVERYPTPKTWNIP